MVLSIHTDLDSFDMRSSSVWDVSFRSCEVKKLSKLSRDLMASSSRSRDVKPAEPAWMDSGDGVTAGALQHTHIQKKEYNTRTTAIMNICQLFNNNTHSLMSRPAGVSHDSNIYANNAADCWGQ